MKSIDEMIAVMAAYKEGKNIEWRSLYENDDWSSINNTPIWDWGCFDYRIKTEEPKPTHRPYKTAEEVIEDMRLHGPMFRLGVSNIYNIILNVSFDSITYNDWTYGTTGINHEDALNRLFWQDGTPFGRKIEE